MNKKEMFVFVNEILIFLHIYLFYFINLGAFVDLHMFLRFRVSKPKFIIIKISEY